MVAEAAVSVTQIFLPMHCSVYLSSVVSSLGTKESYFLPFSFQNVLYYFFVSSLRGIRFFLSSFLPIGH